MMVPPKTRHQRLVSKLNQIIANYIDSKNGNCEVFPAPFAVFLNFETENRTEVYTFSDIVKAGIYDDLEIDFSKVKL